MSKMKKSIIAIIISIAMWMIADLIYINPERALGNAIWWREIWIMSMSCVITIIYCWE